MLIPEELHLVIPGAQGTVHRLTCYRWDAAIAQHTILCVHGLTRNGRDFDFLASALANNYQVLCPDMPGRGKSQWLSEPSGYTNAAYIGDIAYLLQSRGITKVIWIGTSMGGILGMMAANMLPGLIDRLVLNDIGCFIPPAGLQRIKEAATLQTTFTTYEEASIAFRKRCATFGIRDEAQWQHLLTYGLEDNGQGTIRFTYDPAIFAAGFPNEALVSGIDLWALWKAVASIPLLLIRGTQSDILSAETAQQMQDSHPALTRVEIEDTGHAPMLMEPKQIALIQNWVSASYIKI